MNEDLRPVDPATGKPLPVRLQPGYYPGFETLSQQKYWDQATRDLVLERVSHVPPIKFFNAEETQLITAICNRVLPQDDRDESRRIPIVPRIDDRLATGRIDGYRFEGMPSDADAYRIGLKGIEMMARAAHHKRFADLGPLEQDKILKSLHDGKPVGADEIWRKLPVHRFWTLLVQDCVEAYYAHPWAWDEVGFGGPAYPRGYMRLERGEPEPWEVEEQRYEWGPPPQSASSLYEPVGGMEGHTPSQGQEGTH